MALMVKNLLAYSRHMRDVALISYGDGSGRFPGGGHGIPLQYSRLENPMDGGAWRATVHRLTDWDTTEVTQHACAVHLSRANSCP